MKRPIDIEDIEARVKKAERRFCEAVTGRSAAAVQPAISDLEVWLDILERVRAGKDPLLAVMSR